MPQVSLPPFLVAFVALVLCGYGASPARAEECHVDDFGDGVLDVGSWSVAGLVTEANGVANFESPGGAVAALTTRFALRGDFDVQVDFGLTEFPHVFHSQAQLLITFEQSWANDFIGVWRQRAENWDHYQFARWDEQGGMSHDRVVIPSSDVTGKFRVRRVGNLYTGYYWSSSSQDWVEIGSLTWTASPAFALIATHGADGGWPTVEGSFDDFDVCADELTSLGDCDSDGSIDLADFGEFVDCMLGPGVDSCSCSDLDSDLDTDLADFALFQQRFIGS